ncbi:uncharacterized protein PgNI_08948 [Pyricularia grisea]|uniref:Uncharacterized protein n=1 Tax=Pyricularia grisea TaxID=148305 RepID=A0A6P8AX15_PYRGI|nr:uncharacterized protein PgNI_08948 [Pyricularia grisea]TLD06750.1 hypothetical protein PgNI_08948 [Pyricularia grisea]
MLSSNASQSSLLTATPLASLHAAISAIGTRPRRNLSVASVPLSRTLNLGTRNRLPMTSRRSKVPFSIPPRSPIRGLRWAMSLLEASTIRMPFMASGSKSAKWLLAMSNTDSSGNTSLNPVPVGRAAIRFSSLSARSSSFSPPPLAAMSPMYDSPISWLCERDKDTRV